MDELNQRGREMRIKTVVKEDILLKLSKKELVWLQVLLKSILYNESLEGWKDEVAKLSVIFEDLKPEGARLKSTTKGFEETELRFLK